MDKNEDWMRTARDEALEMGRVHLPPPMTKVDHDRIVDAMRRVLGQNIEEPSGDEAIPEDRPAIPIDAIDEPIFTPSAQSPEIVEIPGNQGAADGPFPSPRDVWFDAASTRSDAIGARRIRRRTSASADAAGR